MTALPYPAPEDLAELLARWDVEADAQERQKQATRLLDRAKELRPSKLEEVVESVLPAHLTDPEQLLSALNRYPGLQGSADAWTVAQKVGFEKVAGGRARSWDEHDWQVWEIYFPDSRRQLGELLLDLRAEEEVRRRDRAEADRRERDRRSHNYVLVREVGSGGTAVVHLARHRTLGRWVAYKEFRGDAGLVDDPARFVREALRVSRLAGFKNIVPVLDAGLNPAGKFYIVFDFVGDPSGTPHPTLRRWREVEKPDPIRVARVLVTLAEAVQYAHDHQIYHMDVKPDNVLVRPGDQPCLTDFGFSADDRGWGATPAERLTGFTPEYAAPEVLAAVEACRAGGRPDFSNIQADVYGLGAVLCEALTGEPPVTRDPRESPAAYLRRVRDRGGYRPVADRCPALPADIAAVCERAIHPSAADRFLTAREFAAALDAAVRASRANVARSPYPGLIPEYRRLVPAIDALEPVTPFVGRDEVLRELAARVQKRKVIPVTGPTGVGKTQLVAHCFDRPDLADAIRTQLGDRVSLLAINLNGVRAFSKNNLVRRVALALDLGTDDQRFRELKSEDPDDRADAVIELFDGTLGKVLRSFGNVDQRLILIIDGYERIQDSPDELADLDALLCSRPVDRTAVVLVSRERSPSSGRKLPGAWREAAAVQVQYLPSDAAVHLYVEKLVARWLEDRNGTDQPPRDHFQSWARELLEYLRDLRDEFYRPGEIVRQVEDLPVEVLRAVGGGDPSTELTDPWWYAYACRFPDDRDAQQELKTRFLKGGLSRLAGLECDRLLEADGRIGSLGTLAMLDAFDLPVSAGQLERAGVGVPPFGPLESQRWVVSSPGGYSLTPVAKRFLKELAQSDFDLPWDRFKDLLPDAFRRLAEHVRPTDDRQAAVYTSQIETAAAHLDPDIPAEVVLRDELLLELALVSAADPFFPLDGGEFRRLLGRLEGRGQAGVPAVAVAGVVCAARCGGGEEGFVRAADAAVRAVVSGGVDARAAKAFDAACWRAQARSSMKQRVLDVRRALAPRLEGLAADRLRAGEGGAVGLWKWAVSWVLNAVQLCVETGADGGDLLDRAEALMGLVAEPRSARGATDRIWLCGRIAQLRARTATDPADRARYVRESFDWTTAGFTSSLGHRWWLKHLLACFHRLLRELPSDPGRLTVVRQVEELVEEHWGTPDRWDLMLRCLVAAAFRAASARFFDRRLKCEYAEKALRLLAPTHDPRVRKHTEQLARDGDSRAATALAKAYATAADAYWAINRADEAKQHLAEAQGVASKLAHTAPSVSTWRLAIDLARRVDHMSVPDRWQPDSLISTRLRLGAALRATLDAYKKWYDGLPDGQVGVREAQLELDYHKARWAIEGSLMVCAGRRKQWQEEWERIAHLDARSPNERKRAILRILHDERVAVLDGIRRRCSTRAPDGFPAWYFERAYREAQYRRLMAVYDAPPDEADVRHVAKFYERATELWPTNFQLLHEIAHFYRYTWQFDRAIGHYRRLIAGTHNGDQRREGMTELVEVLLTTAIHLESVFVPGSDAPATPPTLVAEARGYLDVLFESERVPWDIHILRDRVELERGEESALDWAQVERTYREVFNGNPIETFVGNIRQIRAQAERIEHAEEGPRGLADLVIVDPTRYDYVQPYGLLFLRRAEQLAERGTADEARENARRAYCCFLWVAFLQKNWDGRERSTNMYHRARAIALAVRLADHPHPFDDVPPEFQRSRWLLDDACRLFTRAAAASVGQFRHEVDRRLGDAELDLRVMRRRFR